ncbi:hypothetical protein CHU32_08340 [Superficieibacter electus]|uniref:Toxin SymE-like domain-containing protein n=1 Tax=Superficieibacter electus TaxID=2022662 RepID=A0A2P5GRD0_9ENTR|nr:SymE family type I addiction module toxin [Superficieibacter electus]POP45809.1 hypothetical protein CHU33_06795 [Superficieibacter electus]POP49115.1 hypothetical protein CHU32_08340 [Superficieibacter electus]
MDTRHTKHKTKVPARYSQILSLYLKGDWLKETGFAIGTAVTAKISGGCIVLMAESDEVRELRDQLYQVKRAIEGIKTGMNNALKNAG